jgi:hypothetical protein
MNRPKQGYFKGKINLKQMISSGMHENLMKKHVFFNLRKTK